MADKIVTVNRGATYQRKDGDEASRVVVFLVDRPRGNVRFAPLGSAREDNLSIEEFLDQYELIAQQGEALPEDRKANAAANKKADADAEAAQGTGARAPKMDTRTASPTREALEARADARNA